MDTSYLVTHLEAHSNGQRSRTHREAKDLPQLSALGHFLKGSSAALGVRKVKDSCEKIQNYGNLRDEEADKTMSKDEALPKIKELLKVVGQEYDEAADCLKQYYEEQEAK